MTPAIEKLKPKFPNLNESRIHSKKVEGKLEKSPSKERAVTLHQRSLMLSDISVRPGVNSDWFEISRYLEKSFHLHGNFTVTNLKP